MSLGSAASATLAPGAVLLGGVLLAATACGAVPAATPWQLAAPPVVLDGIAFEATVTGPEAEFPVVVISPAGRDTVQAPGAVAGRRLSPDQTLRLTALDGRELAVAAPRVLPGWFSILPPILAIALALLTRQVLVSLVLGAWFGSMMLAGWQPLAGLLRLGDHYLVSALADTDNAAIILFTSILGGMVGIMARGGLSEDVVATLRRRVGGRRGGQLSTAVMGTVIFFDDYANTLLVGTTMRPLTDRLRISREKLAYLVDSTAAPVVTVAAISTWVGFELGLIQDAMQLLAGDYGSAYGFFLRSLPYSFYPWLTLLMVYLVAASGRDFGPMRRAEERAQHTGELLRPGASPASETLGDAGDEIERPTGSAHRVHPLLALLPVLTVVLTTAIGLVIDGRRAVRAAGMPEAGLRDVLGQADSFAVLMWAAMLGSLVALLVVLAHRRLGLRAAVDGFVDGCRAMLIALSILLLAWSLSAVCGDLFTAPYLVDVCRGALSARLLPAVTFVLAAAVSFATGTSWGTMAILMPLVFPLGAVLPVSEGLAPDAALGIHLASVSAVLAGSVFGDHCSPISDTTIMSSLASGCDHIDHVRTQLPYALAVGLVALVCGYLPAGWGLPAWAGLLLGAAAVAALVLLRGRPPGMSLAIDRPAP